MRDGADAAPEEAGETAYRVKTICCRKLFVCVMAVNCLYSRMRTRAKVRIVPSTKRINADAPAQEEDLGALVFGESVVAAGDCYVSRLPACWDAGKRQRKDTGGAHAQRDASFLYTDPRRYRSDAEYDKGWSPTRRGPLRVRGGLGGGGGCRGESEERVGGVGGGRWSRTGSV